MELRVARNVSDAPATNISLAGVAYITGCLVGKWISGRFGMSKVKLSAVICLLASTIPASAQVIEVASIKPHSSKDACPESEVLPGRKFILGCFTAYEMVREGLDVIPDYLTGGPKWIREDLWDISAKVEGGSEVLDTADFRSALLKLAEERFHVKLLAQTRQVKGFALMLPQHGKLGPAIVPNRGAAYRFDVKPGAQLIAQRVTIKALADYMKWPLGAGRAVEDKTGLTGEYDLTLTWTPLYADQGKSNKGLATEGPTIFAAIKEQLGLRVRTETVNATVYVFQSAERPKND